MTYRIAVGRFWTESHSFSPLLTNRKMFECGLLIAGNAILAQLRGSHTEVGGFLSVLDLEDVTILPTLAAQSMCGGPIERPVWEMIHDGIVHRLAETLPVDGVLFSLHGSTVAEAEDDCCGNLLDAVRRLVGPDTPVVATLDMHANPTEQLLANATALISYKTYPHHDFYERGEQAARLLIRTLRGEVKPTMALTPLPLDIGMFTEIQLELIAQGIEMEAAGKILACSVLQTHQGLDVSGIHALSAIIVTDNDAALAQRIGQEMMWQAWQQRRRVKIDTSRQGLPLAAAVSSALEFTPGTVVMTEWGDGITAGFPGDNATLITELMNQGFTGRALLIINDPDLVQRAIVAGVGNQVKGPIGGRWGESFYQPVALDGRVRLLFDGILPPSHEDHPSHLAVSNTSMGLTAVVQVESADYRDADNRGHYTVVATSIPVASTEPIVFRAVGIEPADYRIVLVKAIIQHRAHFASLAVGFVDINDGRYVESAHAWRKRQPKAVYPFTEFSDEEIWRYLGLVV